MGRSGRGGGGGGRSGGFSGGMRSGGSFSGGRSSGRSGRGGGFSGGFSGGFGRPSYGYRGPVFFGTNRYYGGRPPRYGGGRGCSSVVLVVVFLVIAAVVFFPIFPLIGFSSGSSANDVAASTVAREPLPAGSVDETAYYTDECGWITNANQLTSGMKTFYRLTGVQPYLYIADGVNGSNQPSSSEIESYAASLYDQLFTDEAHFLLVFCDDGMGSYICGYQTGSAAKTVMDDEAVGILADYLDRYYSSDLDDEEFFSLTFEKTAERIMTVTKSPWPTVLIVVAVVAGVVVLFLLFFNWWKKAKAQKNLEDQKTAEILNTPLETFGDSEAEDLAKKYEKGAGDPGDGTPHSEE